MANFINTLRQSQPSILPRISSSASPNELRLKAAGALIEVATTLSFARKILLSSEEDQSPVIEDLLLAARDSIYNGGDLDQIIDLDPESLPSNSLISRLMILLPDAVDQSDDHLAAATTLSLIDTGISVLLCNGNSYKKRTFIKALESLIKHCLSLPERLSNTSKLALAA